MSRSRTAPGVQLRRESPRRGRVAGHLSLAFVLGLAPTANGYDVSNVTGTDTETEGTKTAETVASVSVRPSDGARIEMIQSNDDNLVAHPGFITYSATGRAVSSGASNIGWNTRVRTAASPDPAWVHHAAAVPNNTTYPFNVVWGDPALASNPGLPLYVFMGALSMPTAKFISFAGSITGTVQGNFANTDGQTPIGGSCIYRSIDGGLTFSVADCVIDQSADGISTDSLGHFYDGGAMAITTVPGSGVYSAFYTAIDVNTRLEASWMMGDVTSTATHPFQMDPTLLGTTGPQAGSVNDIDTHVQLRASPSGDLWKMSASDNGAPTVDGGVNFTPADLKINIRNRNADADAIAEDAVIQISVDVSTNLLGEAASVRTAQDFDFDVGLNEQGQEEMRFVYVAADSNGVGGFTYYLQGGSCTYSPSSTPDLNCSTPAQWRTAMSSTPLALFPAVRYGLSPGTDAPTWMVTYQAFNPSSPTTFAVFAGNMFKDASLTPASFAPVQVGPSQGACPDVRGGDVASGNPGYWGDYDAMAYDPVSGNFIRPFTDSTQGCVDRQSLNSNQVYISTVEVPGLLSCTIASGTPESAPFEVDTGFTTVGSSYGQPSCPNQFLVDVDLTKSLNGAIAVAAQWSDAVTNCTGLNATMTVFALSSAPTATWQVFDRVTYQNSGTSCVATSITHTNSADNGFEGANIQASGGFSKLVVAVEATQTIGGSTQRLPVLVFSAP